MFNHRGAEILNVGYAVGNLILCASAVKACKDKRHFFIL